MIRFPNPGSNPAVLIDIFVNLHSQLDGLGVLGIDDISRAMIRARQVTSLGAVGDEALRRSTRQDRSLDPIFNQSKAYVELFRLLGWLQSTPKKKSLFSFSSLGNLFASTSDRESLMRECLLGIAYPNDALKVKGSGRVRLFATILRTMNLLTTLSRDEIIVGPMSITNDTDSNVFEAMVLGLARLRETPGSLKRRVTETATTNNVTCNTLHNYTRFPLSVLAWSRWCDKRDGSLAISSSGRTTVAKLQTAGDFRTSDFHALPDQAKPAFIKVTYYAMLQRAGCDVTFGQTELEESNAVLAANRVQLSKDTLFSAFQQLSSETIEQWTPELVGAKQDTKNTGSANYGSTSKPIAIGYQTEKTPFRYEEEEAEAPVSVGGITVRDEILKELGVTKSADGVVAKLVAKYSSANRDVFYPYIVGLFNLLGFDCRLARGGQNYNRADATIVHDKFSIPIEIKSPGEEAEISVKAVRQALENKVVLLARHTYPTSRETTSLVVGLNTPSDRSDVYELIKNIRTAFSISIGVIDLRSLVTVAVHSVGSGRLLRIDDLFTLEGVADAPRLVDPTSRKIV